MASEAIRLEREKRKTAREERLWSFLQSEGVQRTLIPALTIGVTYKLGQTRMINRDLAGFLVMLETVLAAGHNGVTDKYALAALAAAAGTMYAATVRPTGSEALVELNPGTVLGGDGKLFFWDIPLIPDSV